MFRTLVLWKSLGVHQDAHLMTRQTSLLAEPKSARRAFRLAQFKDTPFRPPAALLNEVTGTG